MADIQVSKSQARLTTLLNIEHDGTYSHASRLLQAAGYNGDGIPAGHTWRTAAKLSDSEIVALSQHSDIARTVVSTQATRDLRAERNSEYRERMKARDEQYRTEREYAYATRDDMIQE